MAAGLQSYQFIVEGLDDLVFAMRYVHGRTPQTVGKALKAGGQIVADKAKSIAASQGLRDSGQLIAQIKTKTKGPTRVYVVDTATRPRGGGKSGPFAYPGRYEFGDRKRPFLVPAADAKRDEVERIIDLAMRRLLEQEGLA